MASQTSQQPYIPKQVQAILKNKVDAYERTGGQVTAQFASTLLDLAPPFTPDSIVHDNACGSGTVTAAVLSSHPPTGIKIYGTDLDGDFVSAYQKNIEEYDWPAEVQNMKCEKLDFPDNTFTHSFTNIAIFMTANGGLDAAKEIYRTLKPGGTAVVNCWQIITWLPPMKQTHDATKPDRPWPMPVLNWSDGKQLWKIMEDSGFKQENLKATTGEAWAITKEDDLKSWAETSWAYLAGMAGWNEQDEQRWDEAVSILEKNLREANGTTITPDGEVRMIARQHVVIAKKA